MRTAFVTGATGFLGCEIARQLALRAVAVTALTRSGALPGGLQAMGVRPLRGDLDDSQALAGAMANVDAVFHVAANVGMWRGQWAESFRTNVLGTRAMVDAALAGRVGVFVFTSSAATIGKPPSAQRGEEVRVDEHSDYNLEPLQMVYPHTKWLSEQEVLRGTAQGLSAIITHPTAVFGPGDWKHNLLPLFRAAKHGTTLAVPRGLRTTCDVRDVANAHLDLAERGRPGERYILGGESVSVRELMTRIAEAVGGRPPLFTIPDAAILRAGSLMDAVADLTGRPPLLSREMAIQSTFTARLSSDKAAREIGYASRPLDTSLRDAAAWYREQGLL